MVEITKTLLKDLGLQREVLDSLPYAVVGGSWEASFENPVDEYVALSHIVPHGLQLKVLFLRVWTQEAGGARFSIEETNPFEAGHTGAVEAYPVVGSVPPFKPAVGGPATFAVRDYPMLEDPGAEALHGSLRDPIHILEGSIDFKVHDTPTPATGAKYAIVFWGVQKTAEEELA